MALVESQREREEVSPDQILRDSTKAATAKIAIFQYVVVALFIFLISAFWALQVQNPDLYSEAAERNRVKSTPILAPRGKILDRDGRVIVDNKASYSLLLNRDQLKFEHLPAIADALKLDYNELADKVRRMGTRPQMVIKDELTRDEMAWVESHRDPSAFPEMEVIKSWRRLYPQDGYAAHAIGYVGEISEYELDQPQFIDYHPGDIIGKDGIEKQYDAQLRGTDGERRVLVDSMGRERQVDKPKDAVAGKDLELALDLDLQSVAELAMQDKRGGVVALDPRTGEVLAMVSRPSFDPNKFTGRISRSDWQAIAGDPYKPLMNRAIQAEFAPGSTFKPIVALAGLETGVIDEKTDFHCPGGASFYGHYFSCHLKRGHGDISLHRAIAQSCDVFFYNVGNKLGIDRLAHYAEMAGIGSKTGIDLPNERESTMPSTRWKLRNYRQKWYAGETISVAIGQGAVTVSPLELATAIGGLSLGGKWMRPHMVRGARPTIIRQAQFNPESIRSVIDGMYAVVNEGGTGRAAALPNVRVCGKTGSAQLASNQFLKGSKLGQTMKDNGWFVAFAPEEAPEIVVVGLYENGEHGDRAAWVVRDVMKAYFDKKERLAKSRPQLAEAARPQLVLPFAAPAAFLTRKSIP